MRLRLLHLGGQRVDRGLHRLQRLDLESVDRIHRLIDVRERGFELVDSDRRRHRLLVDRDALGREQLRGRFDQVRRRRVERRDLVENELLVRQGLRDDDRRPERRDRGRGRAIDPFDELGVVAAHQVDRQVSLHRDRELRQQVLMFLPDVEQDVDTKHVGSPGIGGIDLDNLCCHRQVQLLRDVHVLDEALHRLPEVHLLLLECGVVSSQLVLALVQPVQDRVDMRLRTLVAIEVLPQLVAEGNDAEQLAHSRRSAWVEIFDLTPQFGERFGHSGTGVETTLADVANRRVQHPVAHRRRGADVGIAHCANAVGFLREPG